MREVSDAAKRKAIEAFELCHVPRKKSAQIEVRCSLEDLESKEIVETEKRDTETAPEIKKTTTLKQPPLVQRREYLNGKWTPFQAFASEKWQNARLDILLPHGGTLQLFPGWMNQEQERNELVEELQQCNMFRVYQTQSTDQPRAQFLLHRGAKQNFRGPTPGYEYHSTKMKSFPLNSVKGVKKIWGQALDTCQVDDFQIGANVIYYRGGRDRIHYHADDNQNESVIFAVIVKASDNGRCVSIKQKSEKAAEGDFEYKIFPGSGDAYLMDGLMQQHYIHSVLPKKTSNKDINDAQEARVVVIFRDGSLKTLTKDTGRPIYDLTPPPPLKAKDFGNCVEGLEEGGLYTRATMIKNGFHLTQRGVSGSMERGCEAISLSGHYKGNHDKFDTILYTAELTTGAKAMLRNVPDNIPIRVFRKQKVGKTVYHRYDGVYSISNYFGKGPVSFILRRNSVGIGPDKNRVETKLTGLIQPVVGLSPNPNVSVQLVQIGEEDCKLKVLKKDATPIGMIMIYSLNL